MKNNPTRIRMPQGSLRQGFTMVKLLVSITIVLTSLVFVSTGKIRDNAQQTNAVSSLRQIGIANVASATPPLPHLRSLQP